MLFRTKGKQDNAFCFFVTPYLTSTITLGHFSLTVFIIVCYLRKSTERHVYFTVWLIFFFFFILKLEVLLWVMLWKIFQVASGVQFRNVIGLWSVKSLLLIKAQGIGEEFLNLVSFCVGNEFLLLAVAAYVIFTYSCCTSCCKSLIGWLKLLVTSYLQNY